MTAWQAALESTAFATWLRESGSLWAYPLILTLHTAGMIVLVGMNWTIALRMLGFGPGVPIDALKNLFRVMWLGFWVNFVTGVMLFAADATTKGSTTLFVVKLGLVVLAVIAAVLMKKVVYKRRTTTVPGIAKAFAATSLVLWVAAIAAGRLMAYV